MLTLDQYRVEGRNLFLCFLENIKWLPLLTIFLGGVSIHVFQAIACHMLSINMTWGATAKEAKRTSFFAEIPTILKKFKFTFVFCILMVGGPCEYVLGLETLTPSSQTAVMIVLAGVGPVGKLVPYDWHITSFVAIWPIGLVVTFHFVSYLLSC